MEELLLGTLFSYNKLDIVDQENVVVAVFLTKFRGSDVVFVTDGVNELVGKGLRADVKDLGFRVIF